jgi:hypothetical protein
MATTNTVNPIHRTGVPTLSRFMGCLTPCRGQTGTSDVKFNHTSWT